MIVIWEYIAVYSYLLFAFFVVGGLTKRFSNVVLSRKIVHILTGFVWFLSNYFFGNSIHQVIISVSFIVVAILSKKYKLIKSIEVDEYRSNGTIYYAISLSSLLAISFLFPELYQHIGFTVLALAVGDGFATIVGKYLKSRTIYKDKTLLGFISCIVFSFAAFVIYNYVFSFKYDIFSLLLIAIIVGIFEEQTDGLDNITVPFACFFSFVIAEKAKDARFAFLVFVVLFLLCFFLKLMTYHGALVAAFIGASFFYISGIYISAYCTFLYIVIALVNFYRKKKRITDNDIVKKTKEKDIKQVLANGLISLLLLYAYNAAGKPELLVMCLIVYSNSFIDSIASDVGSLSAKKPYDFIKHAYVLPGTSGGISWLGSVSAAISSVVFSSLIWILTNWWPIIIVGPIIMIICCLFDSLLGSTIQVKYRCECGLITEKEYHCGKRLERFSGIPHFDNDLVNFSCSLICGLLSLIVLGIKP